MWCGRKQAKLRVVLWIGDTETRQIIQEQDQRKKGEPKKYRYINKSQ